MKKEFIESEIDKAFKRLAAELRAFVAQKKLNEGDFADSLDIGRSTFSNFLNGKVGSPGMDLLLKPILLTEFKPWFVEDAKTPGQGIQLDHIAEAAYQVDQVVKVMQQQPEALEKAKWVADLSAQLAEDGRLGSRERGQKFLRGLKSEVQHSPASAPAGLHKKSARGDEQKGRP